MKNIFLAVTIIFSLGSHAQIKAGFVKENSDKKVRLVGYSANLGRTAGYQQMSLARANVIKQKLVGMGVQTEKIMVEAKGIEGQSATASEEEKAKSRRVEVYVQ